MSKRMLMWLLPVWVAGCSGPSVDLAAEAESVMQTSRDWSRAAGERDLEKVLSYWTDDALLMPAGSPTLRGKDEIRGYVAAGLNNPDFEISWEPQSAVVSEAGDMAYLVEESSVTMPGEDGTLQTVVGRTVTIWRKNDAGEWKCAVDIPMGAADG